MNCACNPLETNGIKKTKDLNVLIEDIKLAFLTHIYAFDFYCV